MAFRFCLHCLAADSVDHLLVDYNSGGCVVKLLIQLYTTRLLLLVIRQEWSLSVNMIIRN